jgi:AraC-like DNA-binding protein/mannose-6-phosphate isomerase-like protein (cupin superfamily)
MEHSFITSGKQKFPIDSSISVHAVNFQNAFYDLISSPHLHSEFEILYVDSGRMRYFIEGEEVSVKEGEIIFLKNFAVHSNEPASERVSGCLLHFSEGGSASDETSEQRKVSLNADRKYYKLSLDEAGDNAEVIKKLLMAEELRERNRESSSLVARAVFYLLLSHFGEKELIKIEETEVGEDKNKASDKIKKVIGFVEDHYDTDITVEDAAELINVTPSYFCRIFKASIGNTFVNFINNYRIMQAKQKLLKPEATITEVMYETGFSNYSYFNRVFRKYSGCSPTEYKQRYLDERGKL